MRSLLLLILLLFWPAHASTRGIEPRLVAEGQAPPGGEIDLAIHMTPAPGWHGYWQNPGDAGLPMNVQWHLPPGYSVEPLRYPVPTRLTVAGLMNYVFERDYAVLVRLKVPKDASGSVPILAEAQWLACTDKICVPEQGRLSLNLSIGTSASDRSQFDRWRQQLARPIATVGHFAAHGDRLSVAIPLPASAEIRKPYLFPISEGIIDYEAPQTFRRSGDWVIAELEMKKAPSEFDGVLAIGDGRGLQFHSLAGAVPVGGTPIGGSLGWKPIALAVLGAIAGGMLLNLMPCVFPILALKALHVAKASEGERSARSDALAYAAGAVVGTGALGGVLLAIRAAGAEAGWAFQLQDPRTAMLLLLLAVAITANLLGLFELPVLGCGAQPAGSFGTGALAAFVATPCAGPFLGAALGTALLLPAVGSIAVFAALGLGLALPFVAVAYIPSLRDRLPRPGRWMGRLKGFLAIPMAASAVAALWLLFRQGGERLLLLGIAGAVGLTLLVLVAGQRQRRGHDATWAIPVALAMTGLLFLLTPAQVHSPMKAGAGEASWSEERVASEVHRGRPVFVYFTADWCLTCKVNEAAAIDRDDVREAFTNAGVKVLAGDWTNGDPAITRFLESRGRAGVPLYLWYVPGKAPEELPQVLTPSMLIERAKAAKP